MPKWQFWIDRGGTFTDLVAVSPAGHLQTLKLLSTDSARYPDAILAGIRKIMSVAADAPIPSARIASVRIGTTVATNALLERKGDATLLVITRGFGDALRIGYQNRPNIFALQIELPEQLYCEVLEVEERLEATGAVLTPLQVEHYRQPLRQALARGMSSVAIVFMHAYRNPVHEQALAELAQEIGFAHVTTSYQASPLIKLIGRGDTAVVDAYVSPVLQRYVSGLATALPDTQILFMQSSGGLTDAANFQGRNSILSGPAGGVVGGVKTSMALGHNRVIGFDMGGTSTDVWHFSSSHSDNCGEMSDVADYERVFDTQLAGVRLRVPMMNIHTVAAGGGSLCYFDGSKLRVGPASAGAEPGPACYRRGGPLTITDCNLLLGKLAIEHFPRVFGASGDQPLDVTAAEMKCAVLARDIELSNGQVFSPHELAAGCVQIAVQNMASAIKKISTQRGYDVRRYALACFGGAGGQHACLVADVLGMDSILIHPLAGVLSAYGMGLADLGAMAECTVNTPLHAEAMPVLEAKFAELLREARSRLPTLDHASVASNVRRNAYIRYQGSDATLPIAYGDVLSMASEFAISHQRQFSFLMESRQLIVDSISLEITAREQDFARTRVGLAAASKPSIQLHTKAFCGGEFVTMPVYQRHQLVGGETLLGPVMIVDTTATTIIEPGWRAAIVGDGVLHIARASKRLPGTITGRAIATARNPVQLEIFNNLFMSIAEQMGAVLANTAHSVNIKERLDFSCALFDDVGNLVANAPHVPVHLGSMGETVTALIASRYQDIFPGDAFLVNSPYHGGTHLPDLTVVTPVFAVTSNPHNHPDKPQILFYVASRAHHADIGGDTPGSIPPHSQHIDQEGVLIEDFRLIEQGQFRERALRELLCAGLLPVRNIEQNIADLQAQIAANTKGVVELTGLVEDYGLDVVQAYMGYVQDNAEEAVRRAIAKLRDGKFTYAMDNGAQICVAITVDAARGEALIDFAGTSPQQDNNFNAPSAVCKAAVLYVLRTLVDDAIPLNAGCLKPVQVRIPEGSLLNPRYPAAVVAGNVETSQYVADALYGALGVLAGSQGTMNNVTFGNEHYQYYETLCGGAGAGPTFNGASAVQVHMTNSRLTDPEILELRYPVRLEEFSIRKGSGGAGQYRGGDGVTRKIRFLETMNAAIVSGHRRVPTFGVAGGGAGTVGRNSIVRADGRVETLGGADETAVERDDVLVIETPGGGGFGVSELARKDLELGETMGNL